MPVITSSLALTTWPAGGDLFDHAALAANFVAISGHDHSINNGVQISSGGLAADSVITVKILDLNVTTPKIGNLQVTTAKIADANVTIPKLADAVQATIGANTPSGSQRRGKVNIPGAETRTNVAYGLMPTPDRVQSVVLATDGLIFVAYQALWQASVSGAGSAAVFIGANQLVGAVQGAAPSGTTNAATYPAATNIDAALFSTTSGLQSGGATGAGSTEVTTGQIVGNGASTPLGGTIAIFAAAGTYDISVQFKASSGSVTAKKRHLWVWTRDFT